MGYQHCLERPLLSKRPGNDGRVSRSPWLDRQLHDLCTEEPGNLGEAVSEIAYRYRQHPIARGKRIHDRRLQPSCPAGCQDQEIVASLKERLEAASDVIDQLGELW